MRIGLGGLTDDCQQNILFVEQNIGETKTNLKSLKGLIVVMGYICCSHCPIHISEVMEKLNITFSIHTTSYSDFSLLFHLLGLLSISEKKTLEAEKSFKFVSQHLFSNSSAFLYSKRFVFFYPKKFVVKFKLAHFQPAHSTSVSKEVFGDCVISNLTQY